MDRKHGLGRVDRTVCGREPGKRAIVQAVWVGQHSGVARLEWTGGSSQTHVHAITHFPVGLSSRVLPISLFLRVPYWGRDIAPKSQRSKTLGAGGVRGGSGLSRNL